MIFLGTETTGAAELDIDVPKSRSRGGYFFDYGVFGMSNSNIFALGSPVATSSSPILVGGILTPDEAMSIDAKTDDGIPNKGSVRGLAGDGLAATTCVTVANLYALGQTGLNCTLGFKVVQQ